MDFDQVLEVANKVLTVVVYVGGAFAFIFHKFVGGWIRSKFETEIGSQLASHKHKLDRELEAYKMSMVRELEQQKANIDLQRAIALQIASTKVNALTALYADLSKFVNVAASYPVYPSEIRKHSVVDFNSTTNEFRAAYRAAEIYLPHDLNVRIATLTADMHTLAIGFSDQDDQLDQDDERLTRFLVEHAAICSLLLRAIDEIGVSARG